MGQLRKPKKKKVTEQPEDMPDEVWQFELLRRKAMTEDRQKHRINAKEKKNALIVEAAEAMYLAKHAGSTVASQSGKSVAAGATQGSSDECIFASCLLLLFCTVVVGSWYFTAFTRTFYVCFHQDQVRRWIQRT